MDILTLLGLLLAITAVALGQFLEGGHLSMLVNGPALLIVLGGTLGATMVQSPLPTFVRAMRMVRWVFRPPPHDTEAVMKELLQWCRTARRDGLLGLESIVDAVRYDFSRKALQLLIDGNDPVVIRETLQLDSAARESRDLLAARVFEAMGGYAPTLGILGAVIGLIQVMNNLADPSLLGHGIGIAFVATVYGVGFANVVLLPIANKLKALVRDESRLQDMITVGIVAIADGENPRIVESRLMGLL
ncbi:MAG: flagellar motor protein [Gammaproteobacteria bacterium]